MTENYMFVIVSLGIACFCGVVPLGFAAILFFTSRKRGRVGSAVGAARKTTIAALQPGQGLVRLQGQIAARTDAIDGSPENAIVYLRLKVEIYESDSDSSGWRGFTEKAKGIPFQLQDGSGSVWVNPEGLDKQLLGDGIVPDENKIQATCILLGIDPRILRGRLRFRLWELRAGQTVTVVGVPFQAQGGLVVGRAQGQPFVVSPLLGQVVDASITGQTTTARTWMLVLGIPGAVMLLCGLIAALVMLARTLTGG